MEGAVPRRRIDKFKNTLKEGSIYRIRNFDFQGAKVTYRAVDYPKRVCFTQRTIAIETRPQPENFPRFAYDALLFAVLARRMEQNTLLSDVVGLITSITEILPPAGANQQQRRQIYIIDGNLLLFTLWGQQADMFDTQGLHSASTKQPIVDMFVGMLVGKFLGMLAFKATSVTKWHINVPIPDMDTIRENTKNSPYRIEWHNTNTRRREPTSTTIAQIADMEPNRIMGERYKFRTEITEIVSTKDWCYRSCRDCWKKVQLEGDTYKCPRCPDPVPMARYKIAVNAVDVASSMGQTDFIPPEISDLVGRKYTVTVSPTSKSLDADYHHYQVENVEPFDQAPPLPQVQLSSLTDRHFTLCYISICCSNLVNQTA